jgi:hypothetical protein
MNFLPTPLSIIGEVLVKSPYESGDSNGSALPPVGGARFLATLN